MKKFKVIPILIAICLLFSGCAANTSSEVKYPNFTDDRVISYQHLKGGETQEYAGVILYEYEMDNYTKYQVSYLSCTCRDASQNYQHLMYIEINNNNNSAEEATIRNIEYQYWGDSSVNPQNGLSYEDVKKEFLPYLQYKSKAEIDAMTSLKDIKDAGQVERNNTSLDFIDAYTGASVTVDNTLAILHALFEYHAEKYYN